MIAQDDGVAVANPPNADSPALPELIAHMQSRGFRIDALEVIDERKVRIVAEMPPSQSGSLALIPPWRGTGRSDG